MRISEKWNRCKNLLKRLSVVAMSSRQARVQFKLKICQFYYIYTKILDYFELCIEFRSDLMTTLRNCQAIWLFWRLHLRPRIYVGFHMQWIEFIQIPNLNLSGAYKKISLQSASFIRKSFFLSERESIISSISTWSSSFRHHQSNPSYTQNKLKKRDLNENYHHSLFEGQRRVVIQNSEIVPVRRVAICHKIFILWFYATSYAFFFILHSMNHTNEIFHWITMFSFTFMVFCV